MFLFYSIVSKSPVEVANSLLHGLQIDTSPARNSLFHSKSDDIESGIAIAMSFASPQASITDSKFFLFSIFLFACFLYYYIFKTLPSSTLTYIYFLKLKLLTKVLVLVLLI